jgi:multiple sugar transport system permease protein
VKRFWFIARSAALWAIAIVVLMPLLMTLGASFMGKSELTDRLGPVLTGGSGRASMILLPEFPTLKQYVMLLLDTPKYLSMFWNSVSLAVPIVLGQVIVGTLAAWGFARFRFPGRGFLFMLYIALMMMPFQVMLVPSYLSLSRLSLLDTRWAVILPGMFGTFSVFILRQFFAAIPDALIESARIDGAGELKAFGLIALPLGMSGIASMFILSFLDNWNLIEQPMTFLRSQDLWPLSLYLTKIGESNVDVAMAASIIALLPTLLLFLYCESYLVKGIQMTGIKE